MKIKTTLGIMVNCCKMFTFLNLIHLDILHQSSFLRNYNMLMLFPGHQITTFYAFFNFFPLSEAGVLHTLMQVWTVSWTGVIK